MPGDSLILINMQGANVFFTLMPYEPTPFPDRKERSDCVSPRLNSILVSKRMGAYSLRVSATNPSLILPSWGFPGCLNLNLNTHLCQYMGVAAPHINVDDAFPESTPNRF